MATRCHLPLPNEFQYKYGADWNNEFKLGTLALAADEALRVCCVSSIGGVRCRFAKCCRKVQVKDLKW